MAVEPLEYEIGKRAVNTYASLWLLGLVLLLSALMMRPSFVSFLMLCLEAVVAYIARGMAHEEGKYLAESSSYVAK